MVNRKSRLGSFFVLFCLLVFLGLGFVLSVGSQTIKPKKSVINGQQKNNTANGGRLTDSEWVWRVLAGDFPNLVCKDNLPLLKVCLKLDNQQVAGIEKLAEYDAEANQMGKEDWYIKTEHMKGGATISPPPGEPFNQGVKVRKLLGSKDEDFREWLGEQAVIQSVRILMLRNKLREKDLTFKDISDQIIKRLKMMHWDEAVKNKRFFKMDKSAREKIFKFRIEYAAQPRNFKDIPAHHGAWLQFQKSKAYQEGQRNRQSCLGEIKTIMDKY